MKVWKFPLEVGENVIRVPGGSTFEEVHVVSGETVLYAVVDDQVPFEKIGIHVVLTNEYASNDWKYLGTAVHKDGLALGSDFVVHVFCEERYR